MYLLITKKKQGEKVYQSAKIVESYKLNGKSRQRIIISLGPVNSEEDLLKYKKILESMKKGNLFVNENDIKAKNSREYGITYTTNKLFEKYKIDEILQTELSNNKAKFNIYDIIKALIINRLVRPSSELSAFDWICKDYSEDLDLDYAHYDLTSTYFEGDKCKIAFYGYSRDHRKDRKQVVIGLVMIDGIPVYHEVYNGNTVDKTTLKNMVNSMKEKLGIKDLIVVADRGLITGDNLDLLENNKYQYIIGVQRRNNNLAEELLSKEITSEEKQFAIEIHRETKIIEDKEIIRRYILCFDNQTKNERLENLEEIKEKKKKKIKTLQDKHAKSMSSN